MVNYPIGFPIGGGSGGGTVDPGDITHSGLAGLTGSDDHTQYLYLTPGSSTRNILQPSGDFVPLIIRGNASQTANLLDVQTSASSSLATLTVAGTLTLYNQVATTGVTQLIVRAGAGQATTAILEVRNNSNVAQLSVSPSGVATLTSAASIGTNPASAGAVRLPNGTSNGVYFRNQANNADVAGITIDTSNRINIQGTTHIFSTAQHQLPVGSNSIPALSFTGDTNTGIYSGGSSSGILSISSAGVERVSFGSVALVINETGADNDLRVEGDTDTALFFADASTDRLGVGTNAPASKLDIRTTAASGVGLMIRAAATTPGNILELQNSAGTVQLAVASNGRDFIVDTTTGSKFGTATTQKMGWWNATPVVQDTGWTVSNVTTDRVFDANSTTLDELADVVGTLINAFKTYGFLGA